MEIFVKENTEYKRSYNILKSYAEDVARFISLNRGVPFEEALAWTAQEMKSGGSLEVTIPEVKVLERNQYGDREPLVKPITQLLREIDSQNEVLTPSMTAYDSIDKNKSVVAEFIEINLALRSSAKKAAAAAKMRDDMVMFGIKHAEQTARKTGNNSLSGAQSSQGTPLYNKSAHSSLTSMCRTATSYANAFNERFLSGARHYWCADVATANLMSIINNSDLKAVEAVLSHWGIRPPSAEEVMEAVIKGSSDYWRSDKEIKLIRRTVEAMSPVQRAAYLFSGDAYSLMRTNPDFFRQFLDDLTSSNVPLVSMEVADAAIKSMHANTLSFASTICTPQLAGGTLWDTDKKGTPLKVARPNDYIQFGSVVTNIENTLQKYRDFITVFWLNNNFPASIFMMGSKVREAVLLSDTDSTVFTMSQWVKWHTGVYKESLETSITRAAMTYLTGQLIRHVLATISGTMGMHHTQVKRLSMKNEFTFPALMLTSRAKHYMALISACEGNLYSHWEMEVKGVGLRGAKTPADLLAKSRNFGALMLYAATQNIQYKSTDVLGYIASIENDIRKEIEAGSTRYMSRVGIKTEKIYAKPLSSNWLHYPLWEEVFAPKYGSTVEPPYLAVKASVGLPNKTALEKWIAEMEDRALAERMRTFLDKYGRKNISMFLVPELAVARTGIPKEIIAAVDVREMIAGLMEPFYIILEALGLFFLGDKKNKSRLVSDNQYPGANIEQFKHLPDVIEKLPEATRDSSDEEEDVEEEVLEESED